MKRTALLALPAAALGVAGFAVAATTTTVSLTATGPQPPTVTVRPGDTVQLVNADTVAHGISAKGLAPSSTGPVQPGGTVALPTSQAGTYTYSEQGVSNGRGVIVVQALTTGHALALSASTPFVTYGGRVILRGRSPVPHGVVQIEQRVQGVGKWEPVQHAVSTASGMFSVIVQPTRGVQYRATLGEGKSKTVTPPVSVNVKPLVQLKLAARSTKSGRPVAATVSIVPRDAASTVNLMRYNPSLRVWQRVAGHQLDAHGSAVFEWPVVPGYSLLRGWLSARTIHGGYIVGFSRQLSVTGVGPLPEKHKHKAHSGHGKHKKGSKKGSKKASTNSAASA